MKMSPGQWAGEKKRRAYDAVGAMMSQLIVFLSEVKVEWMFLTYNYQEQIEDIFVLLQVGRALPASSFESSPPFL